MLRPTSGTFAAQNKDYNFPQRLKRFGGVGSMVVGEIPVPGGLFRAPKKKGRAIKPDVYVDSGAWDRFWLALPPTGFCLVRCRRC